MDGEPVKVTWTREDDLHHGYYHTVSVEHLEAGLDAKGKPVAWLHRSVAPTIGSIFAPDPKHELPFELGMGLVNMPFAIPNIRVENPEAVGAHAHRLVPLGLEHPARLRDPVLRRRARARGRTRSEGLPARADRPGAPHRPDGDRRRLEPRRGSEALSDRHRPPAARRRDRGATASGWGRSMPKGSGLGIAGALQLRQLRGGGGGGRGRGRAASSSIPRVDIAIDCGPRVNPERVRSQMEGAVVMGVGLATTAEITFKDGRVQQNNFDGYEVTRMDSAPREIRVHVLPAEDYGQPLGGVGEPGVPPVAPALATRSSRPPASASASLPIRNQLAS